MRYLISTSMIMLGLVMSHLALAQIVCTQNGASIVCNNGLTGNRVRNMIIWNDRTSQAVTPTAPGGMYRPSSPDSSPYYPANPSYGALVIFTGGPRSGDGMCRENNDELPNLCVVAPTLNSSTA